jgi:hypothetical protein
VQVFVNSTAGEAPAIREKVGNHLYIAGEEMEI